MELEKYNLKNDFYHKKKHRLFGKKSLIFFSFLFVLGLLFVTTFYKGGITGNVVSNLDLNNSFHIISETGIPEINLNGDYPGIILEGLNNSELTFGDNKISLNNYKNRLEIYDFSGKIDITNKTFKIFDGKASRIVLNGIPIYRDTNKKVKIFFVTELNGISITFREDIYLKKIGFITSGSVILNEDKINLNQENLMISNFFGKLKIFDDKMFIEGLANELEIKGKDKKIHIMR